MLFSHVDSLQADFGLCINDEDTSDIKFLIGKDETVRYGHSFVLASRSPYFRLALKQPWKEAAEKPFRKPNIEPRVFDLLLRYMYTSEIEMTMDIISAVVDAAMELQLIQLVSACEDYGSREVGMSTVFDMIALADRHDLKKLWTAATDFFCLHAEKLLHTDDWQGLDRDVLTKVLSLDSIIANELSVWSAVVRYAHHQNGYDHIDCPLAQFPEWPGRLLVKVDVDETDRGDGSSTSDKNKNSYYGRSDHEDGNGHRKSNGTANPKDVVVNLSPKQFLDLQDFIGHMTSAIRFTSLPALDFVRCIQHTNLVPMELCLSVLSFNCLPPGSHTDLAAPRWHGTSILPADRWPRMLSWLKDANPLFTGSTSQPKLQRIYQTSKHGFTAKAFHEHCDNQGPTLTVALVDKGNIIGGYNEASWASDNKYYAGPSNFIYQCNPADGTMVQAKVEWHGNSATHCLEETGPSFGKDVDLRISGNGEKCIMAPQHRKWTYNTRSFWSSVFTITEYEVFRVLSTP